MTGMEPFFLMAATGAQVLGQIQQTNTDVAIANANARADETRAGQERAVAHHQAQERTRQARILGSQQQAAFAASGGGLGGSAAEVMAETAGRGELNSSLELWQGESRARGIEDSAAITRASAKAAKRALPLKVAATILSGASGVSRSMGGTAPASSSAGAPAFRYIPAADPWAPTVTYR